MRVAVLTRDYPPTIGGIATHVEGLVRALRRRRIEVDVYVGRNDLRTLLLPFDIPLKNYDVVHVQSLPYGAFVFGVPMVVTVHSPVTVEFDYYRRALRIASLPAIAFERATLSRARAILAVSEQSRIDLLESYSVSPSKVAVIGNGVEYEKFSFPGEAARARRPTRMLVVSRLEPRKNVKEAIKAVAALPKGAYILDIVGEGSEKSALEELARTLGVKEYVRFLGQVDGHALPEVYRRAAIFLTTSKSEGFGLSLLEAMAAGCACVASDLPTHRALLRDGVIGKIYGTTEELVSCLESLLETTNNLDGIGDAARQEARSHTWEVVAGKVSDTYERVARDE